MEIKQNGIEIEEMLLERKQKEMRMLHLCKGGKKHELRDAAIRRIKQDFYIENIENVTDKKAICDLKLKKEETLSRTLDMMKQKELVDLKLRQHIRETSIELRELESKLKSAYVQKEVAAQIAEKKYLKHVEKMQIQQADEALERASLSYKEDLHKKAEDEIIKKHQYKQELQDQIIVNFNQRQFQYEEFLKEKKLLDDIIQQIHDEDRMKMEYKMMEMRKTQYELEEFKANQEIWKKKEKQALEEENRRIIEYLKEKEKQYKESVEKKMKQAEERESVTAAIATKIYMEQLERKEREQVIQELMLEEAKEKDEQNRKKEFEKMVQSKIDLQNKIAQQFEDKKRRLEQEELEEAQYKQELLEKALEDEKLEQLSAEKRRRKMMEYRRSIDEIILDRRMKREAELKRLLYLQEQEKIEAQTKKKVIEEERLRLLKEHAHNLIGFLPSGLLRAEDLPHLGSDFVKSYKKY